MKCENCAKLQEQIEQLQQQILQVTRDAHAMMLDVKRESVYQPTTPELLDAMSATGKLIRFFGSLTKPRLSQPITLEELKAAIESSEDKLAMSEMYKGLHLFKFETGRTPELVTDEAAEYLDSQLEVLSK